MRILYSLARPGQPLGVFYLIRWGGVNAANGLPTFLDVNGNRKQFNVVDGSWTNVADGSAASAITASDRVVMNQSPYPKLYGGITQTFNSHSMPASICSMHSDFMYITKRNHY